MIIVFVLLGAMFMYAAYDYFNSYRENLVSNIYSSMTSHAGSADLNFNDEHVYDTYDPSDPSSVAYDVRLPGEAY